MPRLRPLLVACVLAAACGTSSTPPPDGGTCPSQDLAPAGGKTFGCYDVFSCYFGLTGGPTCSTQDCFDACNAKAKQPDYATHADQLTDCLNTAVGTQAMPGACYTACTGGDSMACAKCYRGTFSDDSCGKRTFSGAPCSALATTCWNEK